MNAGKSTVAKLLIKKLPRTAHIEKLRQFIEWMTIEESIPYNMQNIISLTRNFITLGNLSVVISYPVSGDNFKLITEALKDLNTPIFAFTLAPTLEKVTTNRGTRELAEWEIEQIKKTYAENFQKPDYGIIIDNTLQTPEETVEVILQNIK
jgi:adenylate kinase family enzyme